MNGAIFLCGFLILAGLVGLVAAFFDSKPNQEENEIIRTKENENTVTYLRKTGYFLDEDIAKYNWLDFSIKEVSFPEEPVRYYAVVTVTGHDLGTSYANVIIRKVVDDYDFNPHRDFTYSSSGYQCVDTYDEVVKELEVYFQAKKRHEDPNRHNALKRNYYYFDTKEEAAEAICAIKKKIDSFYRDKELSTKQITENEIKITFEK